MIPANTWKQAPLATDEKEAIGKFHIQKKRRKSKKNLNTWISPDGQVRRQIDYVMIDQTYRNTVRRACAIQGWRGNMAQQRQHATMRMDINLILVGNYHKKPHPETGKELKYDNTNEGGTAKLEQCYQEDKGNEARLTGAD